MRRGLYVLLGVLLVPTVGLVGDVITDGKFTSTMSTGAPLEVASDDMVANLNADMVDGVEGTNLYTKAEVDALVAEAADADSRRWFYLTTTTHQGGEALTACDSGFHMASISEICDPSNLRYAVEHPAAVVLADSGNGAPTNYSGWVRTGGESVATGDTTRVGQANCQAYSSSSGDDLGTAVFIPSYWYDPTYGGTYTEVRGTAWHGAPLACNLWYNVWCIED